MQVKELTPRHMSNLYTNLKYNNVIIENYSKMIAVAVITKAPQHEVDIMRSRKKRMESCNRFWLTETYEKSKVKQLMQTYLCKDKFCNNCKRVKQLVMKNRFLPYMELYKDSLYHFVLTVQDCSGESIGDTIYRMGLSFKTLVNYLNGNKKISGLDLTQYGFHGCIRSLEITYKGDNYHPHFHVAAVFDNPAVVEDKYISNRFSQSGKRLFTEFETIIQRMWWLLINRQRLTKEVILCENVGDCIYSCIVDKFHPDDYKKLFGYIIKTRSEKDEQMHYKNLITLYKALNSVRQIQGYGIFYNVKAAESDPVYTEQERALLAEFIVPDEQPVIANEPLSRLANDNEYTVLKKYRQKRDIK